MRRKKGFFNTSLWLLRLVVVGVNTYENLHQPTIFFFKFISKHYEAITNPTVHTGLASILYCLMRNLFSIFRILRQADGTELPTMLLTKGLFVQLAPYDTVDNSF